MLAPPTTVTVKSATGTPVTYPVPVTDGPASDPALPPVTPEPAARRSTTTPRTTPTTLPPPPPRGVAGTAAVRGAAVMPDATGSTGASRFCWTQISGPAAALTGATTAKPTFAVPFYTTTTATAPAAAPAPPSFQLTATSAQGTASAPAAVTVPLSNDVVAVGKRGTVGTELRIDGTSLIDGLAGVRTPPTTVVFWNVSNPAGSGEVGDLPVDTLGAFPLRLRPGPSAQVTWVLMQSTRGGTPTATLAAR